jgi:hypothetical protein
LESLAQLDKPALLAQLDKLVSLVREALMDLKATADKTDYLAELE